MAEELEEQLKEVGSKLQSPPSTKDALIKLLKKAGTCLSELDQSVPKSMLESLKPLFNAIVKPELLKHEDRDIKLLVATCICDITRITAPVAPYPDDVLRDIFRLIVNTFSGLSDTSGPSFGRRVVILETLARYRSLVVLLDLDCDDLVNELFSTFFSVASDAQPGNVQSSMESIMVVLLEETEDIREDLLFVLLSVLGRNRNDVSTAARRLAMNVIEKSAAKLEPGVKQFLISSISGDSRALSSQIDYHEVIYDIYSCSPQILLGVIPYLTGELLTDQLDTRLKAVRLVGDLFALPGSTVSEAFQPIFSEFLKRLTDRVVDIRMSVLEHVKTCLLSNPLRAEAPQIISALCDRLLDYDENVRKQVVTGICDVACHAPTSIPVETAKLVAERLRDKSILVKMYTMERLAEIHKCYCLGVAGESIKPSEFDWIPGKILRCLYDKDFRSDTIEYILCGSLFPADFSIKDKVTSWVRAFSGFDKVEVKALEKILEQKQRLQQEMQKYLSLRNMYQDGDAPELHKKVLFCFRIMSRCFNDPVKAEENFQILDQLKDTNVWKVLTTLLDPNTEFAKAHGSRDDLLKIVGEKHRLYDFLRMLSVKCSYLLFNKEHVKELLLEAVSQKSAGCTQLTLSCMNLLVILARFSPLLLNGSEENLVELLKDDDEVIKEGVLHVLARAGGSIQEQLGASSSSVELVLERICLEGRRRHAKYAVHALAAITKDDGLKSLSVLYKRLVDMLEDKMHLPSVLQSLGCIAQSAMPIFETRENEIEEFVKRKILECSNKVEEDANLSWDERSEICSLKIFGIKTLVKSYLPVKDANLRLGIDKLLELLKNILSFGEISKDIESSLVDKAHLRLNSAKAILRLSRHWDHKIPVDVFHLTVRTSEISFPQARKAFLSKVYQYTRDRLLDSKYTCSFLFTTIWSREPEFEEEKHNLSDIIQTCQQMKARQLPIQSDAKSEMAYPENILPYLVHTLAHQCPDVEKCKDVKAFEIIYRQLHFFLSMLVHGVEDPKLEASTNKEKERQDKERLSTIISIFQGVKCSEDVVDASKSKNSHAICDLGLLIAKRLAGKQDALQTLTACVSLPPVLYKSLEKKDSNDTMVSEGMSWLADESVLAHFESLKLNEESVLSEAVDGEKLSAMVVDGSDVPLGKVLKHLKAQGAKAKKLVKRQSSPAGTVSPSNDDILKMVREINLDNLGISNKFESTNGHESLPRKTKSVQKHQQKKRKKGSDAMSLPVPVPKRRRSSSAFKLSLPLRKSKGLLQASNDGSPQARASSIYAMEMQTGTPATQQNKAGAAESDLLASCLRKNPNILSKRKQGFNRSYSEAGKIRGDHDLEKLDLLMETDEIKGVSNSKSLSVHAKKRRSINVAGLAKCSSKAVGSHTRDLIDRRIKVWWPMDKQFYEGVVKSYDPKKKKHVVLYDDGDVEVLRLEKERWELIDAVQKSVKALSSSVISPNKESPERQNKYFDETQHSKKLNKMVRGKRTPRKNLKHVGRRVMDSRTVEDLCEAESEPGSGVSTPEHAPIRKVDAGNEAENPMEEAEKSFTGGEESEASEKSVSEGKQMIDSGGSPSVTDKSDEEMQPSSKENHVEDTTVLPPDIDRSDVEIRYHSAKAKPDTSRGSSVEESDKEESFNSEVKRMDDAEGKSSDSDDSYERTSDFSNSHVDEASDNETLGMWKLRVRKSG